MNTTLNLGDVATVPGEILEVSGHYFSGNMEIKVRAKWPDNALTDDFKSKLPEPRDPPPPDPNNQIGFFVYQILPPRKSITFSTNGHLYWCSLESMEGNVLTLSPHMAANIKAMERLVLPK